MMRQPISTANSLNSCSILKWVFLRSLLQTILSLNAAFSGTIVKHLPGFGDLPFHLETGYISVGDSELFYYFIESQGNPKEDPLFLWFTGGPGCSSFNGLIYEIGPMEFDIDNYVGGLPKLRYYNYAWTKTASIIFLDSPVGTGFSYSRTADGWPSSDSKSAEQACQFLRKWLNEHPQYLAVQLFLGGDSYSGIIVPLVVQKVVHDGLAGIIAASEPRMNLKGYLVGSPRTDSIIDEDSKVVFAHRMVLISDELYEAAKTSCNENYVNPDLSNKACITALAAIEICVKDLYTNDILEPNCKFASPEPNKEVSQRSMLQDSQNRFPPFTTKNSRTMVPGICEGLE